jgi:hypothetical protein
LLKKREHKIRRDGVANPGASLRIARKARTKDEGKVEKGLAIQRAGEQPTNGCAKVSAEADSGRRALKEGRRATLVEKT